MPTMISGPMAEPATSEHWQSVHGKQGAHYNTYGCKDEDGMVALRRIFPNGEANELNFVLFSTSGVHGMYTTIEQAEVSKEEELVTFLIIQPRLVCLRFGNCEPKCLDDFNFLKRLRQSSQHAIEKIGAAFPVDIKQISSEENTQTLPKSDV